MIGLIFEKEWMVVTHHMRAGNYSLKKPMRKKLKRSNIDEARRDHRTT